MLFVSDNKQALEKEMWEYRRGMWYNHSQIRTQAKQPEHSVLSQHVHVYLHVNIRPDIQDEVQLHCFDLLLCLSSKNPDRLKTKSTSSTNMLGVTVAHTLTHRCICVGFVYVASTQSLVTLWSGVYKHLQGLVSFRTVHKLTDTHPLRLHVLAHCH